MQFLDVQYPRNIFKVYLKYQKGMMNIAQTVGEKIMLSPEIELKTCFKLVIW